MMASGAGGSFVITGTHPFSTNQNSLVLGG